MVELILFCILPYTNEVKMKSIKQYPRFDFIPQEKWDRLTKQEFSDLMSYKGVYSHLKKSLDEIDKCKERIKVLKERVDGYYPKLMKQSKKIDYLRDTFNLSVSITIGKKYTNKKTNITSCYYNISISRRNLPTKSSNLGNDKKIKDYLYDYYKNDKRVMRMIKKDWLKFLKDEVKYGGIFDTIMDITIDNKGKIEGIDFTLDTILP